MSSFTTSFLVALLVLLIPILAVELILTDEILEHICANTRNSKSCHAIMRKNGFFAGKSLDNPFETIVEKFIAKARIVAVNATSKATTRYETEDNQDLKGKYLRCVHTLDHITISIDEANHYASEGNRVLTRQTIINASTQVEWAKNLLPPRDKVHVTMASIMDVFSMITSICGRMPDPPAHAHHHLIM